MLRRYFIASSLLLAGCASAQLNINTLDIADTVGDVYTRETLSNLSKFIDNPHAIPSFIDLSAGTVQTSNAVTPSAGLPLTRSFVTGPTGALTSGTLAGSTFNVTASDTWQQNWNITPVNEANTLRNFQALYRRAIGYSDADIWEEYHTPWALKNGKNELEPYAFKQPHCVKCMNDDTKRLEINDKLKPGWLYADGGPRPFPNQEMIDLGHYGNHELFMTKADFNNGVLSNFVMFMMPNTPPTESTKTTGTGGGAGGSHRSPQFVPQSLGIQPPG